MLIVEETEQSEQIITLEQRREHLKLSPAARRRQLAEQAEKLAAYYKATKSGREIWQGGDIFEL
ncbi:hypothetical protein BH20ACI1_BH20ACI1_08980 [soil metagenome]